MSGLDAQSYNRTALLYLSKNADEIDQIASELGVSKIAVAASMARQITHTKNKDIVDTFAHFISRTFAKIAFESMLEKEYQRDKKALEQKPGIFDGSYSAIQQFWNHPLADVGPGSIKILTAFQIIEQYSKTRQGKSLGLNQYHMNDLRSIVRDLANPNNPLSIKIAALVALNGQKFFQGKLIAGIPWEKLYDEQKASALLAYYTVGEHEISIDMKENKFFPFKLGPEDGQVGGWISYGQNYENLRSVLTNRRAQGFSVAPMQVRKKAATENRGTFPPTAIGYFHTALMSRANGLAALKINQNTKGFVRNLMMPTKSGLPYEIATTLSGGLEIGKGLTSLHQAGAVIAPLLTARRRDAASHNFTGNLASFHMSPAFLRSNHTALPSVAPVKKVSTRQSKSAYHSGNSPIGLQASVVKPGSLAADAVGHAQIDQWQFSEMLSGELDRQARLPPSGATGFNPRLSPAWAGVKLPN